MCKTPFNGKLETLCSYAPSSLSKFPWRPKPHSAGWSWAERQRLVASIYFHKSTGKLAVRRPRSRLRRHSNYSDSKYLIPPAHWKRLPFTLFILPSSL